MPLSAVRAELRDELLEADIFGNKPFEVWINEDAVVPTDGTATDQCLDQARSADLVLVLYNGKAGWAASSGTGICHAEMAAAVDQAAAKVFVIELPSAEEGATPLDVAFRDYVNRRRGWRRTVTSGEKVIDEGKAAVAQGYAEMARRGAKYAARSAFSAGDALDWSRLSLADRAERMRCAARGYIESLGGAAKGSETVCVPLGDSEKIMYVVQAIPEALAVGPARELVGQPFVKDHRYIGESRSAPGPVHIICCNKGVTVSQARRLLGIDDATYVETAFGIYVADEVTKVQVLLLAECRDETSTRRAVESLFDWMQSSGELGIIESRAKLRREIAHAIKRANRRV